ncbi:MAG TPA: hypothetical protein VH573_04295 [Mycobacteriales bacterium]
MTAVVVRRPLFAAKSLHRPEAMVSFFATAPTPVGATPLQRGNVILKLHDRGTISRFTTIDDSYQSTGTAHWAS